MTANNQYERAYEEIRHLLITQAIPSGNRLTEQVWAQKLQVNRADIRQALARLFAEGLLEKGAKGGFFVRTYSPQDVDEINEARLILETGAARLAVERAREDDIAELEKTCEHMELMAQNGYHMGVYEADLRFHSQLVTAAHNAKLSRIYNLSNIPLLPGSPTMDSANTKEKLIRTASEHRQMVTALRQKNADKLVELLNKGLK